MALVKSDRDVPSNPLRQNIRSARSSALSTSKARGRPIGAPDFFFFIPGNHTPLLYRKVKKCSRQRSPGVQCLQRNQGRAASGAASVNRRPTITAPLECGGLSPLWPGRQNESGDKSDKSPHSISDSLLVRLLRGSRGRN